MGSGNDWRPGKESDHRNKPGACFVQKFFPTVIQSFPGINTTILGHITVHVGYGRYHKGVNVAHEVQPVKSTFITAVLIQCLTFAKVCTV